MQDPAVLIPNLLKGSSHAWTRFVDACAPIIWAQVRRCLNRYGHQADAQDQEDICQDVFVRLTRGDFALLKNFDPNRAKFSTYLGVIAHSVSVDFLRKQRAATETLDDHAPYLADPSAPNPGMAAAAPLLSALPVNLLSQRQADILKALYDDDMDVGEVAEALGIQAQTVRSAKHKALNKIRDHFNKNPHLKEAA